MASELQKSRDTGDKIRLYIGAGTLGIIIVFLTWVFGAGKLVGSIQKIPDIECRVKTLETTSEGTKVELTYIRKGIDRIERKLDR